MSAAQIEDVALSLEYMKQYAGSHSNLSANQAYLLEQCLVLSLIHILDLNNDLYKKVNKEMVNIERVTDKYDVLELKDMIKEHVAYTNSEVGKEILENFKDYLPKFKKIIPEDYEKMMSAILQMEEKGLSSEQAKIEAFNKIKNGR